MAEEAENQQFLFLEILNSVILIFIITEFHRINHSSATSSFSTFHILLRPYYKILLISLIWITCLLILYYISIIQQLFDHINSSIKVLFSLLHTLFHIGSGFLIFLSIILIILNYLYIYNKFHLISQLNILQKIIIIMTMIFSSFCLSWYFNLDDLIPIQWILHLYLVILSFLLVLYYDIYRFRNDMTLKAFLMGVFQAIIYSLGAIPILMILISFAFLILSALLEATGIHPEDSVLWNQLIYYGTLYGPFYIIYWNAKYRLLRAPYLPS